MNSTLNRFILSQRPTLASGAYRTIEDSPASEEERLLWLIGQEDRLREEIKHGRECLDQARRRVAEQRAMLEDWPKYEYRCGVDCLPELTETLQVQRRVERFLRGWLRRREEQMALVSSELGRHADQQTPARLNAEVERGAKEASKALPFLTSVKPEQAAARCSKSLAA